MSPPTHPQLRKSPPTTLLVITACENVPDPGSSPKPGDETGRQWRILTRGSLGPRRENAAPDVQKHPPRPSESVSAPVPADGFVSCLGASGGNTKRPQQPSPWRLPQPPQLHTPPPMPASWVPEAGREEEVACLAGQARPSCTGCPNLALRNHSQSCQAPSTPVLGFPKAALGSLSPTCPQSQLGQGYQSRWPW